MSDAGTVEDWIGLEYPLETPMGNIIKTKVLDVWVYKNEDKNCEEQVGALYDSRALMAFMDELEFRWENELKTDIMRDGDLRSGKSTGAQVFYRLYNSPLFRDKELYKQTIARPDWKIEDFLSCSPLNLDDCCFRLQEFRDRCMNNLSDHQVGRKKLYPRKYFILDEAGKELSKHKWQNKYVEELKQQLDISAVKREIHDMCLPHMGGMLKGIRETSADFLVHTFTERKGREYIRGTLEVREAKKDRWNERIWWNGILACKFPLLEDDSYWDYHDKKINYVESKEVAPEEKECKHLSALKEVVISLHDEEQEPFTKIAGRTGKWLSDHTIGDYYYDAKASRKSKPKKVA